MSDGGGFLARWSKRKMGREVPVPAEEPAASSAGVPPVRPAADAAAPMQQAGTTPAPVGAAPTEAPPLPNLDDVAKLTRESDYSPYVNRRVDPQVRNAAMKKLFSDPHFNVMDGLDTYIDDYGKPDPLPLSMLRQMTSARALGLFADEEAAEAKAQAAAQAAAPASGETAPVQDAVQASPDGAAPTALAKSPPDESKLVDGDTEVPLRPDAASGRPGSVSP